MDEERDDIQEEISDTPEDPEEPIEPVVPTVSVEDSILNSVKKYLGLLPELTDFDDEILMNINAGIFTLRQLGVGPSDGFTVTTADQTYEEFLGEGNKEIPEVRLYLSMKTKLGFDPPQSSYVADILKKTIDEAEWRLNVQVDAPDTFE